MANKFYNLSELDFFDILDKNGEIGENPAFLNEQIITYIGNKRALLDFIGRGVNIVQKRVGKKRLSTGDLFAGSGIVSRFFKRFSEQLHVNDLEKYSECVNSCYLSNRDEIRKLNLEDMIANIKVRIQEEWAPGIISKLYAPLDDEDIKKGERVFFTRRNAIYIDTARKVIDEIPHDLQKFFLAPLLYGASVHNNTSGVFKGFYKNYKGIGQFGGEGKNALSRIKANIDLKLPIFSSYDCEYKVTRLESLEAVQTLPELDLIYLDPPYNQHPYGSNYFMLNLILENKFPDNISKVSGIPSTWNRSEYNQSKYAKEKLFTLIRACPAKFILISYNSEGFVKYDEFMSFLKTLGRVESLETDYNVFRGSRNLRNRPIKVKEFLFLLERK
ncbi:MAG: DNA adenine methylase [Akkermansia sp.]|nr:DNA adenine methylase [Akkermansia sp.]